MKVTLTCRYCSSKFTVDYKYRDRKFCCREHFNTYRKLCAQQNEYVCDWCGRTFFGKKRRYVHKFCSDTCSKLFKQNVDLREHAVNDNFFKQETPEVYWLLGMLASDGSVHKSEKFISISQSGDEGLKCIQYIKTLLKSTAPITITHPSAGKEVHTITVNSPVMVMDLQRYNIVPRKTDSFMPSKDIINSVFFKYFIWGYIDGDGCIGIYKYGGSSHLLKVSFVCTKNMLDAIINKLPYSPKYYKQKNVWCIYYNGESAYKFLGWLFSDISNVYLSYKYLKYQEYCEKYLQQQRFYKYEQIYSRCVNLFEKHKDLNCMDIGRLLNIPFQTIYTYKHKWEEEKCTKSVTQH